MDSTFPDLEQSTDDLFEVLNAGLWEQYQAALAAYRRQHPGRDFQRRPHLRWQLDDYATKLVEITGLPPSICKMAALSRLCPDNDAAIAREILHEHAEMARAAKRQQQASTIIAAERRRMAGRRTA